MKASCLELRTKLEIEQCRLLDFAEVTGLLDYHENQSLPESLQPEKLVVIAVLTQIGCKLDEFSKLTNRYKSLRATETEEEKQQKLQSNITETYITLQLKWKNSVKKSEGRKEHLMGTNHIFKWFELFREIVKQPQSFWWAAFDEKVFKKILLELVEYNNYLHELMHGHNARKLTELSRKTYLEMVLVRGEIKELHRLLLSSSLPNEHKQAEATPRASEANQRHQDLLKTLVDTKTRSLMNDETEAQKPPDYRETIEGTELSYGAIKLKHEPANAEFDKGRVHSSGTFTPKTGTATEIWVEWKAYRTDTNLETRDVIPLAVNMQRVKELVALLQSSNIGTFLIPRCLGFYDYRGDAARSSHRPMFGLVYAKPALTPPTSDPKSLSQLFASMPCPSLSSRAALAHELADSVLYLHAVRWLHKGIRSDGVVFCASGDASTAIDTRSPYLTGFEYARPDTHDGASTKLPPDSRSEIYVHPFYQGANAVGTFRRSFDIYALGLVLLEIAHWAPLCEVMAAEFKDSAAPSRDEAERVRARLLAEGGYMERLRGLVGDRYAEAVRSCVQGLCNVEDEGLLAVSARLQRDFTERVVENLGAVLV